MYELLPPLLQDHHPPDWMLDDKLELQLNEYFDLFVLVFDPSHKWPSTELNTISSTAKVMVYHLANTLPAVFDVLWTKTGKLSIIEETKKAWKAVNCVVGFHWTLDTPITAKQLAFSQIVMKKSAVGSSSSSTNLYAKVVAGWWMKKAPVHKNISSTCTTFFSLKLPPADLVDLDIPTSDPICAISFVHSQSYESWTLTSSSCPTCPRRIQPYQPLPTPFLLLERSKDQYKMFL
jgi:hypothetical protein